MLCPAFVVLRAMNDASSSRATLLSRAWPTLSLHLPHRQRGLSCKLYLDLRLNMYQISNTNTRRPPFSQVATEIKHIFNTLSEKQFFTFSYIENSSSELSTISMSFTTYCPLIRFSFLLLHAVFITRSLPQGNLRILPEWNDSTGYHAKLYSRRPTFHATSRGKQTSSGISEGLESGTRCFASNICIERREERCCRQRYRSRREQTRQLSEARWDCLEQEVAKPIRKWDLVLRCLQRHVQLFSWRGEIEMFWAPLSIHCRTCF